MAHFIRDFQCRLPALLLAMVVAGQLAMADDGAAPERPDPMSYVAPELRDPLGKMLQFYQQRSVEFSIASLPAIREGSALMSTREPLLATPAIAETTISGSPGAPDVKVHVIGAQAGLSRPAILHIHGGGYITGAVRADLPRLQALAAKHDGVIVSVDYRLAPETPFPGSLEDNYAALKWLFANADSLGVDPTRISVMGESAGGGHAAMLAIAARNRGEVAIRHQILIYPMLDDRTGSTNTMPYWMGYGSWTAEANRFGWSSLLGMPAGSAVVPAGAVPAREENLAGLPPTFIAVGSIDLFAQEDLEYASRLVGAGVATELLLIPGGFHGFQQVAPDTALARRFNDAIDQAISRAFAPLRTDN